MPNDNHVVWDHLNPKLPGGSVAAPFQFVLYSQVGLVGALLGSSIIGLLLGLSWRAVEMGVPDAVWRSLLGTMILLFSIYLAIDSVRNSLIVSYGVLWGVAFILAMYGVTTVARRIAAQTKSSSHSNLRENLPGSSG